jgi:hypothetical protein
MGLDPGSIIRTTIINKRGLRLALDDDVTSEMLDKQDMRVSVREIEYHPDSPQRQENNFMKFEKHVGLELFLAF